MTNYRHIVFLLLTFLFMFLGLLFSTQLFAEEVDDSQKAMQIAQSMSKGKAIGAKFVNREKRKGYKVRLIHKGKIRHIFISLQELKQFE